MKEMILNAARFTNKVGTIGNENDDRHRRDNYDLCQGINMIKLGIVLERMVKESSLMPELATAYKAQAEALLAIMRSENNRIHGF